MFRRVKVMYMEYWIYLILALSFIALGGWTSRIAAGGWPSKYLLIPGQWLFAAPYGFIFAYFSGTVVGLAALVFAACGLRQPTYPYFTLGTLSPIDTSRVPPLDFIVRYFFGAISPSGGQYWRCVAGLTVEGLAASVPLGVAYSSFIGGHSAGAVIALAGLSRAPAYMIELKVGNRGVLGDFLRGAFLYAALVIAWIL